MKTALTILAITLFAAPILRAQFVPDGATNVLANVTNSITGTVTVGTNGSFTLLVLSNNVLVTNTSRGIIGLTASARSNEMRVISPTARWLMGGALSVGSNGPFSRLEISGGGQVADFGAIVGRRVTASNCTAIITDPGSLWSHGDGLILGQSSGGNQLVVSNGAVVAAPFGYAGDGGSGNKAVVTGLGSHWTNDTDFVLGFSGAGNQLLVENGGRVTGGAGTVGLSSTATNNEAIITGAGSLWSNRLNLVVGQDGSRNRLRIADGGVVSSVSGFVGSNAVGTNNEAIITGPGAKWTNQLDFYVGFFSSGNRLAISNGATLQAGDSSYFGYNPGSANNAATISGSGSVWRSANRLIVGDFGSGNRLTATDGAALFVGGHSTIGVNSGASSNSILLSGPGTTLTLASNFFVGSNGPFNSLVVSNGASVVVKSDFVVGANNSGLSNSVVLTDAGTKLVAPFNNAFHHLGRRGSHSSLLVKNGALLDTYYSFQMGSRNVSSNNLAIVTDPGTLWTNGLDIHFGGNGDRLVVSNQAIVKTRILRLITDRGAEVVVTGTGSALLSASPDLLSGNVNLGESSTFSSGNRLVIEKGALVTGNELSIGPGRFSDGNRVIVTDPGSVLSNQFLVHLSAAGSFSNALVVSNGATVYSGSAIMHGSGVINGGCDVVVTGAGSTWSNRTLFTVGVTNSRNQLLVADGGVLNSGDGLMLGEQTSSTNNRIVVSGGTLRMTNASGTARFEVRGGTNLFNAGSIEVDQLVMTNVLGKFQFNGGTLITRGAIISNGAPFNLDSFGAMPAVWDVRAGPVDHVLANYLNVGSGTPFNQLLITNGARLTNSFDLVIGSGISNSAVIAGPGSRCALGGASSVYGSGSLVVSNGGLLTDRGDSYVGGLFSFSNRVVITGPGSVWQHFGSLQLGSFSQGNQLLIGDGGLMVCTNALISAFGSGGNNVVLVTGAGSAWNCIDALEVGNSGPRSQLLVTSGGLVTVGNSLLVGNSPNSTSNRVVVDAGTLLVTNLAGTALLEIRLGTNVLNAGLIEADILRMTNGAFSRLEVNSGTLSVRSSRVSVGNPIFIGNGVSPATLRLAGNGMHDFTGTLGLIITNNATLTGNGTVLAQVQIRPGARLVPGAPIGKISLSPAPLLNSAATIVMEISKNGPVLTNDQIQVTGAVTYGGLLVVSNIGSTALTAGDRFQLFSANVYTGDFVSLALPPLVPPLFWTNKLSLDGSIEVVAPPAIALSSGTYTQSFDSLSMSGTNNPWRDNSTLVGWYAAKQLAPTAITNYIASDGSDNAGALYSFGSNGSSERALGDVPRDNTHDIAFGLGFVNDTATTVSNFKITYTGEQWRNGGGGFGTLTFWYRVSSTVVTSPELNSFTNWTHVTALDFESPTMTIGPGYALDGNQATNRQVLSAALVVALVVPPGQHVFFRWYDQDDASFDQGLAVDDLTVEFSPLGPQITSILFDPTNSFIHLTGLGESNVTYGIEAATNFAPPILWERIGTNAADNFGVFQFTDTNAPVFPMRFYRALFP